jgi:calmodulin
MEEKFDLTADQSRTIDEAFKMFDTEGKGSIGAADIPLVLNQLGQFMNQQDFNRIVGASKASLTARELHDIMAKRLSELDSEQALVNCFRIWDRKGTGKALASDVRDALLHLGHEPLSVAEADDFIREAQPDGEGYVDYARLVKLLLSQ